MRVATVAIAALILLGVIDLFEYLQSPQPSHTYEPTCPHPQAIPKEPTMLDVHPPHEAAHTWKDFFIHVGTICVGLLIAVGLEQSVEAILHHHERTELIERMRTEAERNLPILKADCTSAYNFLSWSQTVIDQLQHATPASGTHDGIITITLPAAPSGTGREPSRAVWKMATAKGTVALLPENLAEIYDRLDFDAENCDKAQERIDIADQHLEAVQAQLHQRVAPGVALHLTRLQRDRLVDVIAEDRATINALAYATLKWAATSDAILHNVQSRAEVLPYLERYEATAPQ